MKSGCILSTLAISLGLVGLTPAAADFTPGALYISANGHNCPSIFPEANHDRIYEFNPATKSWKVFAELPKLLERAGPGTEEGSITGIFTVLVEGDDHNEPISDAARGILDGHVVLDRAIAQRNRFPAINVLRSISRTMPACNAPDENALVDKARRVMAVYDDMAELIRLGAYRPGSDPAVDEAIALHEPLEAFQRQAVDERAELRSGYAELAKILGMPEPAA